MTNGNVLGFLAAPDRDMSLRAVSLALLKVRALDGVTCKSIAKALECSADTVRAASNEETMLSFESIGRLLYFWPEQSKPVRELWERAADEPTPAERVERMERDLAAIKRELA